MDPGATPPTELGTDARRLVYAGPKRLTQTMGVGCIALVAFFGWMLLDARGKPPAGEPSVVVALVSVSIASALLALGLLLVFARKVVVFDLERGLVTRRYEWLRWSRERTWSLRDFAAVGIGLCWQQNGGTKRPFYFVRLVAERDLWVPGGGRLADAVGQAERIAAATGLDTVLEPEPAAFFPVFG